MSNPDIVVVDKDDNVIGHAAKKAVNASESMIRRLIRVFIFNNNGEVLLQQRLKTWKLPNMWDQSVGGHVDQGETYYQAAVRETAEELNIKEIYLEKICKFYQEETIMDVKLSAYNTVYIARYFAPIEFNRNEVQAIKWLKFDVLTQDIIKRPELYTPGIRYSLPYLTRHNLHNIL